jgi:hypothetical protein
MAMKPDPVFATQIRLPVMRTILPVLFRIHQNLLLLTWRNGKTQKSVFPVINTGSLRGPCI